MYLDDTNDSLVVVDYVKVYSQENEKNRCYICKKLVGIAIKCDHHLCNKYFHVECGISNGSIIDLEAINRV